MQSRFRNGMKLFAKGSLISGFASNIGYFVFKDLKNENSIIMNSLKKIPKINKILNSNKDKFENSNLKIINDSNTIKTKGDNL